MDSKQAPERYTLDQVKSALSSGALTRDEMIGRLKGAIIEEERKPYGESDRQLIVQYGRILYELETGAPYVSRKEEALRQVKARLAADDQKKARLRPVKRLAIVLASMLLLVIGGELVRREWLFGRPSNDKQQYVIQGASSDPGLVAESKANESNSYKEIRTENFEEVIPILGYRPTPPLVVPAGWRIHSYFASNTAEAKRFTASYQSDDEKYLLKYEERTYLTSERARAELEQNELGTSISIHGTTVYMVQNTTDPVCVWVKGLTYYSLYGPISQDSIFNIIKTLGG